MARTADAGATWDMQSLALFAQGEPDAVAAAVHMYWLDAQTGWLVIRRATSSNFDVGTLFKTTDGGDSWTRVTIPVGDPVYFVTSDLGWTAGGAAGNQLYATRDGGQSWRQLDLACAPAPTLPCSSAPALPNSSARVAPLLPKLQSARDGVLPVIVAADNDSHLDLYRTRDSGETWELESRWSLGSAVSPGTRFPIAILDVERSVAVVPSRREIVTRAPNSAIAMTPSRDPLVQGIRELDMANSLVGWARYVEGSCERGDKSRCTQTTRLLRTTDGGQTWQPLNLPQACPERSEGSCLRQDVIKPAVSPAPASPRVADGPTSFTATVTGQGFDACGAPSVSQFQNWWLNSPYMAYNLYIGGSALAACTPLTASFVSQLASQGWKFFPTWVGPQAPCAGFSSSISYDTTTAYNQGVTEANSALDAAYNLGLTDATKTGTVIYYDLEGYNTTNSTCRAAVNSFIRGWSYQLKARSNVAGAYGAACGSAVSDWANTDPDHIPNVLWLAWWRVPYQYRSDATVWGAPCLDDTLWVNHQRLRQYAGGHDETWGGVTRNIDSDVLDGVVASISNIVKPSYRYYFPFVSK